MPAKATANAVEDAAEAIEALASADLQRAFADATRRLEKAVSEGLAQIRDQSRVYSDTAGEQIDQAQQYVAERVRERPLAAAGAALGVGVLIGMLLATTSSRR